MSKINSMSFQLATARKLVAGALLLVVGAVALPGRAQDASCNEGFDICFPNLDAGAPNSCSAPAGDADALAIAACFADLCTAEANEPEPGFFGYCCAQGGSVRYDDFCVLVVQTSCPAVAEHCADRCPPVELLTGTVPLAPPPSSCIADYPPFIADVCGTDPFCCTTSWDEICAASALESSLAL